MNDSHGLVRGLSFISTTALVIGSIIGTGVFFKAAVMSQLLGSPALVLVAWLAAGLLSMAGALTYAELGGLLPQAGGEYVYLLHAFGPAAAFLCGWMRLVVSTAGVAALGVGFGSFLSAIVPLSHVWSSASFHFLGRNLDWQFGAKEAVGAGVILVFGILNCLGVRSSGRIQILLTSIKVLGILGIGAGVFLVSGHRNGAAVLAIPAHGASLQSFGAAMIGALWAYDGWAWMPMMAGEIRDPQRNIPKALILGTAIVIALYCLANLAYFEALPFDAVASANSTANRNALPVASKAAETFLGSRGPQIASVLFMISVAGALNAVIMSAARIPYAMAHDKLFFALAGKLNRAGVPGFVVTLLALWSALLAISGTFDQLTDMAVFGMWMSYGLTVSAVFVLRRKMPHATRPYRVIGYPVVPAIFVLVALWLLANTLTTSTVESVTSLLLIGLGYPLYLFFRRKSPIAEGIPVTDSTS